MTGIGITTRNRPEVLDYTLSQFVKHRDMGQDIVVFDDFSDHQGRVFDICDKYGVEYLEPRAERLGIARAKNELVREFAQHDGMILFDDDCFPTQDGYQEHFIKAFKDHRQHHMIYAREPQIMLRYRHKSADEWMGCLGVVIWLSKYAVQKVGGWDSRFRRYGLEHHELTGRCFNAGLSPLGRYISPLKISEYIWCFDTDGDHGDFKWIHRGCMTEDEKQEAIKENQRVAEEMIKENNKSFYRD